MKGTGAHSFPKFFCIFLVPFLFILAVIFSRLQNLSRLSKPCFEPTLRARPSQDFALLLSSLSGAKLKPALFLKHNKVFDLASFRPRNQNTDKIYAIYGSQQGWASYVSEEYFHLFSHLTNNFHWKVVSHPQHSDTWDSLYIRCIDEFGGVPTVILFMESYDALTSLSYSNRSNLGSSITWLFLDDIHSFTEQNRAMKLAAIKVADLVLGSYVYELDIFFPEAKGKPRALVPHAASGIFQLPMQRGSSVVSSVLLSGAVSEWYPYRTLVMEKIKSGDARFSLHAHPGYGARKDDSAIGISFARTLNSHLACITDGLVFNYTIAKFFEIPATGCLLLANSEIMPQLQQFGFVPGVHFIPYTKGLLDDVVDSVLDEKNREAVDLIRKQGQELVWSRHLVVHRAAYLHDLASSLPYLSTVSTLPPCFTSCDSSPVDTIDFIIFSKNRPLRLLSLLESHFKHVLNSGRVFVIFSGSNAIHNTAYKQVETLFPCVHFVDERSFRSENGKSGFQIAVEFVLEACASPYISPVVDEMIWLRDVDLKEVTNFLLKFDNDRGTFQLRLGMSYSSIQKSQPTLVRYNSSKAIYCYVWTSQDMIPIDLGYTTIVDAGVYSASRLKNEWASLRFNHPGELESQWYKFMPTYGPGCNHFFFYESSIVNVESKDKVRSDLSQDSDGLLLKKSSFEILFGNHIDVSQFFNYSPTYSHVSLPLLLKPLTLC
jgi:Glycosyl transferases group 1